MIVLLVWSCYGYLSATASSPDGGTLADVRVAGLITALSFLVPVLVRESTTPPLLSSLIEIRRDLALGRIDAKDATHQLDIAILGLSIEDVFQEDIRKILETLENLNRHLAVQQAVIDKLEPLRSRFLQASVEELREAKTMLQTMHDESEKIDVEVWPALRKPIAALERRAVFIGKDSESRSALSEIQQRITVAIDESSLRVATLRKAINTFNAGLDEASKEHNKTPKLPTLA